MHGYATFAFTVATNGCIKAEILLTTVPHILLYLLKFQYMI